MSRQAERSRRLGAPHLHYRRTTSTNDLARELAKSGAPDGTLLSAEEQISGRGRQGRSWSAPAGSSLLMSLILRDWPHLLPLAAAVSVCDVIGEQAMVKWPNDVVSVQADGSLRKLAGILIEGRPQEGWMVLGIGVNVAVDVSRMPGELADTAASMGLGSSDIDQVLEELLNALEARLAEQANETMKAWRKRDALLGREISWQRGSGIAAGVTSEGKLIVRLQDGSTSELAAGEVHLLG